MLATIAKRLFAAIPSVIGVIVVLMPSWASDSWISTAIGSETVPLPRSYEIVVSNPFA